MCVLSLCHTCCSRDDDDDDDDDDGDGEEDDGCCYCCSTSLLLPHAASRPHCEQPSCCQWPGPGQTRLTSFRFLILKAGFHSVVIFNSPPEWTDGIVPCSSTSRPATVLAERLMTLILVGSDHELFLSQRDL